MSYGLKHYIKTPKFYSSTAQYSIIILELNIRSYEFEERKKQNPRPSLSRNKWYSLKGQEKFRLSLHMLDMSQK